MKGFRNCIGHFEILFSLTREYHEICVGSYVTQNRTEVLSKEGKMARSLASNKIKGTH